MTRLAAFLTPQFDLTDVERFWGGVALILGALWLVLVAVRVLPNLLRDLIVLFRGACAADEAPKVVPIEERRRQLDAAAGRKTS